MPYTAREYAEMHFIYGLCNGNGRQAARVYRARYPNREHYPDYRVFMRVHNNYLEGIIPGNRHGEGRPRTIDEDEILEIVREDPTISVRRITRRTGIPKSTVHKVIKREGLHPFHVRRVQALQPADYPSRVQFCREMLRKNREDPDFFNKVLWSDEASFRRIGIFNIHNLHYYVNVNPNIVRADKFQHQFGVNMWAGIFGGNLLGPVELPARLTGQEYLRFLQNKLPELLEDVQLQTRRTMWLQHDWAPPHYSQDVRRHLNVAFPNRWIGRGSRELQAPIKWPARSPDLNPIDFFYGAT